MKIVMIHGQNHEGTTCMVTRKPAEPDYGYWEERGWHGETRPWKVK